ncbi:MAG: GNAT family N-acetyltransferase [Anaerolineaceae bacterium]|nr:GNAT family N-acetyltransferase [Anaerolineaceae bacterium]
MLTMRRANAGDVNFLIWIDIKDEGVSSSYMANWADAEWAAHREQIAAYISSEDKIAFVTEEVASQRRVAGIYADILHVQDVAGRWRMFRTVSTDLFPGDGRFCAIFQLWVDPAYRRQRLGSQLKQMVEDEAVHRQVGAIYTHTEAVNEHVITLNKKLGYREIYRGPMWDDIERVALLKNLDVTRR